MASIKMHDCFQHDEAFYGILNDMCTCMHMIQSEWQHNHLRLAPSSLLVDGSHQLHHSMAMTLEL